MSSSNSPYLLPVHQSHFLSLFGSVLSLTFIFWLTFLLSLLFFSSTAKISSSCTFALTNPYITEQHCYALPGILVPASSTFPFLLANSFDQQVLIQPCHSPFLLHQRIGVTSLKICQLDSAPMSQGAVSQVSPLTKPFIPPTTLQGWQLGPNFLAEQWDPTPPVCCPCCVHWCQGTLAGRSDMSP